MLELSRLKAWANGSRKHNDILRTWCTMGCHIREWEEVKQTPSLTHYSISVLDILEFGYSTPCLCHPIWWMIRLMNKEVHKEVKLLNKLMKAISLSLKESSWGLYLKLCLKWSLLFEVRCHRNNYLKKAQKNLLSVDLSPMIYSLEGKILRLGH